MFRNKDNTGQGLIELVVAMTILAVIMFLIAMASYASIRRTDEAQLRQQATYFAQEGIEVVKNFKDRNWGETEPAGNCLATESNCIQDIFRSPEPDVPFAELEGTFCVFFSNQENWYLTLNLTNPECTSHPRFRRLISITIPEDEEPGDAFYSRTVASIVQWCKDSSSIRDNPTCEADSVTMTSILYKWKEPQ